MGAKEHGGGGRDFLASDSKELFGLAGLIPKQALHVKAVNEQEHVYVQLHPLPTQREPLRKS
jgi:hypothetical protein